MAYGQLIRRAWETTWRNKALWVFGFLAVICAGAYPGTGRPVSALQYVIGGRDLSKWADVFPFASAGRIDWRAFATLLAALAGVAFVASLVGAVVRMIVRYTAEGALICGVDAAERAEPARLDAMLRGGWARTFGLLLLDLLIRIVSALALLPTIVILLAGLALTIGSAVALGISGASGAGTAAVALAAIVAVVCIAATVLVCVAVGGLATILREYAFRAITLEGRGVFEAVGDAWRLARRTLRHTAAMWLILSLIGVALEILLAPVLFGVALLALGLFGVTLGLAQSFALPALVGVPALLVMVAATGLASGIYYAFRSAAWTLTYRELRPETLPTVKGVPA